MKDLAECSTRPSEYDETILFSQIAKNIYEKVTDWNFVINTYYDFD